MCGLKYQGGILALNLAPNRHYLFDNIHTQGFEKVWNHHFSKYTHQIFGILWLYLPFDA